MNASENAGKDDMTEMDVEKLGDIIGGAADASASAPTFNDYRYCPSCKMKTALRLTKKGYAICSVCGHIF